LGFQYVSVAEDEVPLVKEAVAILVDRNILVPLTDRCSGVHESHHQKQHYTFKDGTASALTDYFLKPEDGASIYVRTSTRCANISYNFISSKWRVTGLNGLDRNELIQEEFDGVVVGTEPSSAGSIFSATDLASLQSPDGLPLSTFLEDLKTVRYSSR
jgi:hypothetical protein